jgi:uncharacterized membrane protein YphA (DoxX/SURF4 family)
MERARLTTFPILALLLRVAVGLTLVVAGAGKLLDATAAQASTEATLHISGTFAAALTVAVSVLEILLGIHLIVGLNLRWSALASVALLGFFLLFVIYLWATGYTGGCGCFGVFGGGSPGPAETARDTILFIAALGAWLGRDYGPSLDHLMQAQRESVDELT